MCNFCTLCSSFQWHLCIKRSLCYISTRYSPNVQQAATQKRASNVCVCRLAHRYKEALPVTRYQSLANPSPHLEAALNKIKVLPKILNTTPAGCRPIGAYSSPSSSLTIGPAMRAARAVSKSIDCAHQNWRTPNPRLLTPSIQV
jgi:hypothetical protein